MTFNFDELRSEIRHKPNITKEWVFSTLQKIEQDYLAVARDVHKVVNVGKIYRPTEMARYDVVTSMVCGSAHPCLIFKVEEDCVYGVILSSSEAEHNIHKFEKSRIFTERYLTNTVVRLTKARALENFVGIFDHRGEADLALNKLKTLYKNIFKL